MPLKMPLKTIRKIFLTGVVLAWAWVAVGQEFEVVSIKPNKSDSHRSSSNSNKGRLMSTNVSLRGLILEAYGIRDYQLKGPEWLDSERFDVAAKFPEALPKDRELAGAMMRRMREKMLVDRFRLVTHREEKVMTVYGLVVGKKGIQFKQVPDGDSHRSSSNSTHFAGTCISMSAFAQFLSGQTDLPVLDMTGLSGYFDVTLDWLPEKGHVDADKGELPVLSVALQEQLGLRLETRKAPVELVVVDHIERVPTEN